MKIYDLVELIENDEELLSNGIQKGCHGVVINVENNKCEVIFLNSKNQGDYACADIDLKSLKIKGKLPKELQGELDVFIKNLGGSMNNKINDSYSYIINYIKNNKSNLKKQELSVA